MTDDEIRWSKYTHDDLSAFLRALVRRGTPSRVSWGTPSLSRRGEFCGEHYGLDQLYIAGPKVPERTLPR